jgi:PAS domain-containing protein
MTPPERRNLKMANLNRLRWLAVWLPTLCIAILLVGEHLFEYGLPQSYDSHLYTVHLPMIAAVAIGAYFFSTLTFRSIRRSREEILRREQEITALEKRFRALVENSRDMTILLNADGAASSWSILTIVSRSRKISGKQLTQRKGS